MIDRSSGVDMQTGSKDIVFDLDSIFFFVVRLHVYNVVGGGVMSFYLVLLPSYITVHCRARL